MPKAWRNITGQQFGRLTVVRIAGRDGDGSFRWECLCSCGETKFTNGVHLRRGQVRSCGCLAREAASQRASARRGVKHPRWRGGRFIQGSYYRVQVANADGSTRYELEHIVIAERALGRKLPPGTEVHHFDENQLNNEPGNLVICHDRAYHKLLHRRARAYRACGQPTWRHCWACDAWKPIEEMRTGGYTCRTCVNEHNRQRAARRRAAGG